MNLKQHLIADWRWVLANSWTVRLLLLSAVLSGAEVALPLFSDRFTPTLFAALSFLTTVAAVIARFVLQQRESSSE